MRRALPLVVCVLFSALAPCQVSMSLDVDASGIAELQIRSKMVIPVKPGKFALAYPKYIPGEHGPSGPLNNVVGFRATVNGKPIRWWRDEVDLFRIECDVPAGAESMQVELTYGVQPETVASSRLARLVWNQILLYPADEKAASVRVNPTIKLPKQWKIATALTLKSLNDDTAVYEPTDLITLIDSPTLMGRYFETVNLTTDMGVGHILAVAADRPEDIALDDETVLAYRRMVQEAMAIFGDRPYRRYQWLISLSDHGAGAGLEHHESSEDGMGATAMTTDAGRRLLAELNAHEYAHTWNGKYRRPAGLIGDNYQVPMRSSLLWMYEGMTQYLGTVLSARAGFWSPEYLREALALYASQLELQQGRTWRPLVDTATCAQILYYSPSGWTSARRDVAFYVEMIFNWLEADMIIRRVTGGRKSLDDFCRSFHGGGAGMPSVKPYEIDAIVAGLSSVANYDWKSWIDKRVYAVSPKLNLEGLEAAGWRLIYTDVPNLAALDQAEVYGGMGYEASLGLTLEDDKVKDVILGMPTEQAGVCPDMKIVGVGSEPFSQDALDRAIGMSTVTGKVDLIVERAGFLKSISIPYGGGHRFPHLVPIDGKPDLLSETFGSRTARGS